MCIITTYVQDVYHNIRTICVSLQHTYKMCIITTNVQDVHQTTLNLVVSLKLPDTDPVHLLLVYFCIIVRRHHAGSHNSDRNMLV